MWRLRFVVVLPYSLRLSLSVRQSQEHNGTVAATEDIRLDLLITRVTNLLCNTRY